MNALGRIAAAPARPDAAAAAPRPAPLDETERAAIARCRAVISDKSKSFHLASRLLPGWCRDQVVVVYAWCRHVDDAIDLAAPAERPAALARLQRELDLVYDGRDTGDAMLDAFAAVVRAHAIPRLYPDQLIAGMEMDVLRAGYPTLESLQLYAHRVAGVVGLLLCHVMGLSDPRAAKRAAHLGIAMQLTNICRDVGEDLRDGRLYLPAEMLGAPSISQETLDEPAKTAVRGAVARLLDEADRFYRSADRGLLALPLRCALAVRTARLVYAAIGDRLRARGCDPFQGRVFVPGWMKLLLVLRALGATLLELPRRGRAAFRAPEQTLLFPRDVLPLEPR